MAYAPNRVGPYSVVDFDKSKYWPTEWNSNLGSGTVSTTDAMLPHFEDAALRPLVNQVLWSPLGTTAIQVPAGRAFTLACALDGEPLNGMPTVYSAVIGVHAPDVSDPGNDQALELSVGFGCLEAGTIDTSRTDTNNDAKMWTIEAADSGVGGVSGAWRGSCLFCDFGFDGYLGYPVFGYARFQNQSNTPVFISGLKVYISIQKHAASIETFDPGR